MRIGINCTDILPNYRGGVTSYTFGLLKAFSIVGSQHNFQIYANSENAHMFDEFIKLENFQIIETRKIRKIGRGARHVGTLMKSRKSFELICNYQVSDLIRETREKSQVLYTPTSVLPFFDEAVPMVVSIHDIQQFHYPEFFTKRELAYRDVAYGLTIDRANYIQASSEFIRDDLLTHYPNLKRDKIFVVSEGVDISEFSAPKSVAEVAHRYGLQPFSFLFMPAQLWPHKNHSTVLKALKLLKDRGIIIPLILTGAKYSAAEKIFQFIEENGLSNVRYLGVVPFQDLLCLYQMSRFMITAVLYESSSLPILESAASGRPVIASRTPPNIEMSNILTLNLFDPLNHEQLADLLRQIWNQESLIREQSVANSKSIQWYSWNNAAQRYIDFIEKRFPNNAAY